MYDCHTVLHIMHPYLDGELDTKEAILIQEHLDVCSSCRMKFQKEKGHLTLFKNNLSVEKAPHRLKAKLKKIIKSKSPSQISSNKRYQLLSLSGMAGLILMISFVWLSLPRVELPHLVEEAFDNHVSYEDTPFKLQFENSDPEKVALYIKEAVGIEVHFSEPAFSGLQIIGANAQRIKGVPTVYIISKNKAGQTITLMLADYRAFVPLKAKPLEIQGNKFYNIGYKGHYLTTWQNKPWTYILISDSRHDVGTGCSICHGANKNMESPIQKFMGKI